MTGDVDSRDDWRKADGTPAAAPSPARPVAFDDVVHAYRWILGREPEQADKITAHLQRHRGSALALRRHFLSSPEFQRQMQALGLLDAGASLPQAEPLAPHERRIVFMHVPKTGGSTVHHHLAAHLADDAICPRRHNNALTLPALDLARYRLVSGHFDRRMLDVLDGQATVRVTMLRPPRERLVSLYRYLASHRPDRIAAGGFELGDAARRHGFEAFLDVASRLNAAVVDNAYVRAFGATLPQARWECAAESGWMATGRVPDEAAWESMLARAIACLERFAVVGLMPRFDDSLRRILTACDFAAPDRVEHLKDTDRIADDTPGFEPVPPLAPSDSAQLDAMTRWDERLYAWAEARFAAAS